MTRSARIDSPKAVSQNHFCMLRRALSDSEGGAEFFAGLERQARRYPEKTTILNEGDEGDNIYFVLSGWVSASKTLEDGQFQIIDFLLPCDMIEPATAHRTQAGVSLTTLSEALVATVPREAWGRMIEARPAVREAYEMARAAEMARFAERILRLGKGTAAVRVAYALLELSVRLHAIGQADVASFHMPLTQKEVGDFTGLSSVHVCRTMRKLAESGIIHASDHTFIEIYDVAALSEIAEIDAERLAEGITLGA